MARRRHLPPFEFEVEGLGKGGAGVGRAPDGRPVQARPAPPGSRVAVVPYASKRGVWLARRSHLVRPAPGGVAPRCAVFGLCGGCALQELDLASQRAAKRDAAIADVAEGLGVSAASLAERCLVHPTRGADQAYGYRNKVELTFAPSRYLDEAAHAAGESIRGRWLGFHAQGRFDRAVDAARCELIDDAANALLGALRRLVLVEDDQPLWDARAHTGIWRHALLRRADATGQPLVGLYTSSSADPAAVARVAEGLRATALPPGQRLRGVLWIVNDGVADVARGETREVFGEATLTERLGGVDFELSVESFFQTNTPGAEVLARTVAEALGGGGGVLLDLYCGIGSLGLAIGGAFDRIVGVEEVEAAIADARVNAARAGVEGTWLAARVEDALDALEPELEGAAIVVDPPRAGLHPRVARRLAAVRSARLVYVACKPGSLGRDAAVLEAGGWRLTDLFTVDLFPQTGHVEMVARVERAV